MSALMFQLLMRQPRLLGVFTVDKQVYDLPFP